MGLFDKKSEEEVNIKKRFDSIMTQVKGLYAGMPEARFFKYLTEAEKNPEKVVIHPVSLFLDTVEMILANKIDFNMDSHMPAMYKADEIYSKIFIYDEATPDFDTLRIVFLELFETGGVVARNLFNPAMFHLFKDKRNYIEVMNSIINDVRSRDALYDIIQYATRVRAYFVDDDTFAANIKFVANEMLMSGDRSAVLEKEAGKAERMAGIYNVDETHIAKTEEQLIQANSMLKQCLDILAQADKKSEQLTRIMEDTTKTIEDISKREANMITIKAKSAREDINAAYNGFVEEQKQEIMLQKDVLLDQIFKESESKLNELRLMARNITATAATELSRINIEASNAIEKITNYVSNDAKLEEILNRASENEELLSKINKLQVLNDKNIEAITASMESISKTQAATVADVGSTGVPTLASATAKDDGRSGYMQSAVAYDYSSVAGVNERDPQPIPEINPLLDTTIPFESRYKLVMDEKNKRMAAGEHFHKMFDDVVIALMEDANPYLIGPSGCGKTYMVNQIASILNMDFIDIGYINEEYDILGFQTATGSYSTPNFYRCYKYGKIAFCDELDNGNSRATVKLNSFLSNNKDASYNFPNGENVKRHNNFRIIAAGNTAGNGADANYNTREKIEESVQQRFTPIYVGYDNYVEEQILKDYVDWYQFIVMFRHATDAWGEMNDCAAAGILTTRDTARIKRYLDNRSFNMDKILDYEFIQTKDMEYLAFVSDDMKRLAASYPEGAAVRSIFALFEQKVNALREKGGIR